MKRLSPKCLSVRMMTHKGFTLPELVVVIVITAIIAAYALFRYPGTTIDVNSQARRVASDIRYTQALAMTHDLGYRINFGTTNTYNITDQNGTAPALGGTTITLNDNVTFGAFANINNGISFDSQGRPYNYNSSTGTDTLLGTDATIPVTASGNSCHILLTQNSGRVSVGCP